MTSVRIAYDDFTTQMSTYPLDEYTGIIFAYNDEDFRGFGNRAACPDLLRELDIYGFAWDLCDIDV